VSEVQVSINGRSYLLSCNPGEEGHLRELSRYLDRTVAELTARFGQIGETRLLVMAALTISDRLTDSRARVEALQREMIGLKGAGAEAQHAAAGAGDAAIRELDGLAQRLEDLARGLTAS